jgi:hypothetical protein
MQFNVPTDKELLGIMLQGAYSRCETYLQKWLDPEYCPEIEGLQRNINKFRWIYAKHRARQIYRHFLMATSSLPPRDAWESVSEWLLEQEGELGK